MPEKAHSRLLIFNGENSNDRHFRSLAPSERSPVWRTAYEGYRLGIGAIFSSGVMFRFFVYGSVLSIAVLGVEIYLLVWTAMNLSERASDILALLIPLVTYVAMSAVQTPSGIVMQRRILLGDIPSRSMSFTQWTTVAGTTALSF